MDLLNGSMDADTRLKAMEDFFAAYAAGFNCALTGPPEIDVEATAGAFADCFVEANPHGVLCGKNDEQFRAQISCRFRVLSKHQDKIHEHRVA